MDSRNKRLVSLLFVFLSGFAGLVYEVCWIRQSSLLFGSTIYAFSTVISVFFGGLAIGGYVFGRLSKKWDKTIQAYGLLEIGIGVLVLLSPFLFEWAADAYKSIYPKVYTNQVAHIGYRLLLVTVCILPITTLIGGTLPLYLKYLLKNSKDLSHSISSTYAINTIGAALGALVSGLYLIPAMGLDKSINLGAGVNILIGVLVLLFYFKESSETEAKEEIQIVNQAKLKTAVLYIFFFCSGLLFLANEILWTRLLSLLVFNTIYTYVISLVSILFGIAIGSMLVPLLSDRLKKSIGFLGVISLLNGVLVLFVFLLPSEFWSERVVSESSIFNFLTFVIILLLPSIISGVSFPLAVRLITQRKDLGGFCFGLSSSINTLGGILGSLFTGFVLVNWLGLYLSVLIVTAGYVLLGAVLVIIADNNWSIVRKAFGVGVGIVVWLLIFTSSDTKLPEDLLKENGKIVDCVEGLNSVFTVEIQDNQKVLKINKLWQGEEVKGHQVMAAHLPMLLHGNAQDVLLIGMGVGQTADCFTYYDNLRSLECVDIEKELFEIIAKHFESGWMKDPRVSIITDDGRNYVSSIDKTYDLISIEIGQIFQLGLSSFYTYEFYQNVHDRLNDGGLVSQFLPLTFFSEEDLRKAILTFIMVFPEAQLRFNTEELLLIGKKGRRPFVQSVMNDINEKVKQDLLEFSYWGGPQNNMLNSVTFEAGVLMGKEELRKFAWSENGTFFKDDYPVFEYSVSRHKNYSLDVLENNLKVILGHLETHPPQTPLVLDSIQQSSLKSIRSLNLKNIMAEKYRARYMRVGNLADLNKALSYNQYNFFVNYLMGVALIEQNEFTNARNFLGRAVMLHPADDKARNNFGYANYKLGDWPTAEQNYRLAVESNEKNFSAWNNLGSLLVRKGELKEALGCFNKSLQANPNFEKARHNKRIIESKLQSDRF